MTSLLQPLSAFIDQAAMSAPAIADYYYRGSCPRTKQPLALPRNALAKAVAQGLMAQLGEAAAGKMYGVLLVQAPTGQTSVLKAFSGLWQGQAQVPGWVPPIPGRSQVALQEARTLDQLEAIKDRLQILQRQPERQTWARLQTEQAEGRHRLNQRHRDRKQARQSQRQTLAETLTGDSLTLALAELDQASRGDKAELRRFRQQWRDRLALLEAVIQTTDTEIMALKRQRRSLSRQLQADMHAAYTLTNFAGESRAIGTLAGQGNLPTGTGDCCAPKLLHAAAQQGLVPLALAEFWWGTAQGDRQPGEFYGACVERCQPIMGFLLAGLSARVLGPEPSCSPTPLPILYEDDWILVVDKPAGLLSVPGRYGDRQDSVLTRLRHTRPSGSFLKPVHRLDQATSGLLVLALDADSHRHLSQQFEQRQVQKTYEAMVAGKVSQKAGLIDLPLWGDPAQRPRQQVHWQHGKPSQTKFEVLGQAQEFTRVAFYPLTGRTHQLRVHAAHAQGLNAPVWGDRLYGSTQNTDQRLHLHAQSLQFTHPHSREGFGVTSVVPF